MSSKDKTRQKLVGSMRKTKAEAGIGTENTDTSAVSPDSPEPRRPKKAVTPETKMIRSNIDSVTADHYQSGRRVWPD